MARFTGGLSTDGVLFSSKPLHETNMTAHFRTIGIIGKYVAPGVQRTLRQLLDFLRQRGCEVIGDHYTADSYPDLHVSRLDWESFGARADLAMVVGGDGTMLYAARHLASHHTPLLGINLGRLGFLTDVSPDSMEATLKSILDGEYERDERLTLELQLLENDEIVQRGFALNDVVVHKWDMARMIELETHVNGRFVDTLRSDGLIIATPTGSTGYALSGGGPLMPPNIDAWVLAPICPHTLSNRPIVLRSDSRMEIRIHGRTEPRHVRISCDGNDSLPIGENTLIRIVQGPHPVRLIHPRGHDHFCLLRAKLGWGG